MLRMFLICLLLTTPGCKVTQIRVSDERNGYSVTIQTGGATCVR